MKQVILFKLILFKSSSKEFELSVSQRLILNAKINGKIGMINGRKVIVLSHVETKSSLEGGGKPNFL